MEQTTQPQSQPAKKRGCLYYGGMGCLVIGGLFILMMIILAIMASNSLDDAKEKAQQNKAAYDAEQANTSETNTNSKPVTEVTQPTVKAPTFVFDLEALYGKNIDEIRVILGEPTDGDHKDPTPRQIAIGISEWDNNFEKDGYELLVTYDANTRNVIDFFIPTNDPSGATKDVESLKDVGNVKNTTHYTFEPVPVINDESYKDSYTGIIMKPR